MKKKGKFILTKYVDTKDKLKAIGYTNIGWWDGYFVFVNDSKIQFDNSLKDCVFTDILDF